VDLGKTAEIAAFAQQEKNSWMSPFVVTAEDFAGTDATAASGPRKADGSLPDIVYMHLAAGSDLIDAGVDVGLPFSGSAPDLGCFERVITGMRKVSVKPDFLFYPNPVYDKGFFSFTAANGGRCIIRLYDISGKFVKTLADLNLEPGDQQIVIDVSDIHEGLYLYRVEIDKVNIVTSKLVKLSGNDAGHSGK
ncbi:MAG: T9SS type A sorting domain-containing protein, partial [Bacteroidales bacterium]|nr:T9SS type A sorting domain-containing protein [Bacteroidales bacterium]